MARCSLVVLLIFMISTPKYGQTVPPLETVVENFFLQYDYPVQLMPFLKFECRPDGYYVLRLEYNQDIKARVKFYDQRLAEYLLLDSRDLYVDWEENTGPTTVASGKQKADNYLRQLPSYDREAFARQPYYGYPGWYNDAIEYWEDQKRLENDDLHALARAYSTAATSLLANYTNFSLAEERLDLLPERPAMNDQQLDQYRTAADKCLGAYAELKERAPTYTTPIGPATLKYANERMHVFTTLLHFQGEDAARAVLEDDLYESYFLTQASNFLNSCPPNAVLVTYGDNDSYPLWYVQAQLGLRTDVIVANISLLNIERYRKMILSGPFGATPLRQGLPDFYNQPPAKIWYKAVAEEPPLPYGQLRAELADRTAYQISDKNWTLPFPYDQLETPVPDQTKYLHPQTTRPPFYWQPFAATNYQLPSDYFLFDVLAANEWQRPLCFLPTVNKQQLLSWEKHLSWNGWVYQVVPDELNDNQLTTGIYQHSDTTYQLWQTTMRYDTLTVISKTDKAVFYHHQIKAAKEFLTHLLAAGEKEKALLFSQQMLHRYPNTIYPWDHHWIDLVAPMRTSGASRSAEELLKTIASNVAENLIDFDSEEQRWLLLERVRELKK